jgi:Flp pilus assembly protein TadD
MMKKSLIILICLIGSLESIGQNKNVVSAINFMQYYTKDKNPDDLLEAKKYIDEAAANEETANKAKTWAKRAEVYSFIVESKDPKLEAAKATALEELAKSYQNTIKYDEKGTYSNSKAGIRYCASQYLNKGIDNFNNKDFVGALENFEKSVNLKKTALNEIDTLVLVNCGVAAERANNFGKAIEYYKQLADMKFVMDKEPGKIYFLLAGAYKQANNDAAYLSTIQEGRKAYPNDKNLIIEELNYYIKANKTQEAIGNLNLAIEKDPQNSVLHYNLGTLYDNLANPKDPKSITEKDYNEYFTKSTEAYNKAITLKPDYFDALYNIGAMYFNKAVKMQEAANAITDNKKYNEASAKADKVFAESLPFLEKAEQVNTDDKDTYRGLLETLKKLYMMMNQADKAKAVSEKLK